MLGKRKSVIALGYFDSVHLGHKSVILSAKQLANKLSARLVVFTFNGNIKSVISNTNDKIVFSNKEREKEIYSLGADKIYFAPITKEFLSMDKKAFLDFLTIKFNAVAFVCGKDYTFSKNASGNAEYLTEYANDNEKIAKIIDIVCDKNVKISTSVIKGLLVDGQIEKVNYYLDRDYSYTGKVVKNRQVGRKLGFKTANINIDSDKVCIKNGVYLGYSIIKGKKYKAIINVGDKPTFNIYDSQIEAHFIDFNGNLYNKEITLYFTKYIRDIEKFDSENALIDGLNKDILFARGNV